MCHRLSVIAIVCLAAAATAMGGEDDQSLTPDGFTAIAASAEHSFALTADGHIVSWGAQSPLVNNTPIIGGITAIAGGYKRCLGLAADGRIISWGDGRTPRAMPRARGFTAIAAGDYCGLALAADGRIVGWLWSEDPYGQVSDIPAGSGFTAIAAGSRHVLALTADGHIVSWGDDESGQVSDAPTGGGFTAIAADHDNSLALTADGHIVSWGKDDEKQVSNTPTGGGFTAIAAGKDNSLALTADGSIVVWGKNSRTFGSAPTASGFVAIAIGDEHALALTAEGHIVSWGEWRDANVTATPRTSQFVAIAAGYGQSLALTADGFIVGWGLGSEATPTTSGFTAIAAGRRHALALTADGRIVSWGNDEFGQVSDTPTDAGFAAIAAGKDHSVALTADGHIVSWGKDEDNQVSDTPADAGFTAIAAGDDHSLALTADGRIVSWGKDDAKQVSNTPTGGGFAAIAAGLYHSFALTADGDLVSWGGEGPTGTSITYTPPGSDFTAIAADGLHSLVLTLNGRVEQWGLSSGTSSPLEPGYVAIATGPRHSLALRADGTIYSWGDDGYYGCVKETPTARAFVPGSISGRVFADRNTNGQRDAGEFGLNGWTVELMDAASQTVVATRTTASIDLNSDGWIDPDSETGVYEFRDLAPDDYEVSAPPQDGWARTLPRRPGWYDAPLSLGRKDAASLDFGNVAYGTVEGLVWADVDGDNVHDVDEPGLAGWTVELVDAVSGAVVDTQVTAGDASDADDTAGPQAQTGRYSFKKVPIGSYEVRPALQAGWASTAPAIVTGELREVQLIKNGVDGVDGLHGPVSVTVTGDGANVYVAGARDNAIVVFARNLSTGELRFIQVIRGNSLEAGGFGGVYGVTVSGDGANVYSAAPWGTVGVFRRDAETGQLTLVQVVRDGADGVDGLAGARSVIASSDGAHVYVAAGKEDGTIVVFERDAATGELRFVQVVRDGVNGVEGLATCTRSTGPNRAAISNNGDHIYVVGQDGFTVAVFGRDAATGELSFIQAIWEGVNGVKGLGAPTAVAVSSDDANVYVAGGDDNSIAAFSRDPATGKLSFRQIVQDGVAGVDGLERPFSVIVSSDGAHVYGAGYYDAAVAVFDRDATTGKLTFVQVVRKEGNDGDEQWLPFAATISGDDHNIYAASESDTVVVLGRGPRPRPTIVDVPANGSVTGVAFGVAETVDVSGRVFWDSDGDSLGGSGQRGLDGWRVELLDAGTGENVMTTVTASVDLDQDGAIDLATETGQYSFTDLLGGDYEVRLVLRPRWTRTSQSGNLSLALVSGDPDVAGQDFGVAFANPAEIRGQVWEDLDGDGVRDAGEPGLDGWTVELVDQTARAVVGRTATASRDLNGDGAIDPETEAGLYSLQAVAPRVYEIRQVPPANWRQTAGPAISLPDIKFHIVYRGNDWHVDPFGMEPVWDESDWLDIDPPRPAVWKMNDDYYTNVWRPGRVRAPKALVAYTPGKDENVYWFIIDDAPPDEAFAKDNFSDLWVQITERHRPGKLLLTARHVSGAAAYQAIVGPDGTETEIPPATSVSILLDMLGFIEPAPGEIVEDMDFGNRRQGAD
ncbi:hypothetical protein LCGC14_0276330 [marine sediment metagenome]|uniref:SD-repeat containing protein B domain-containing protein n=1 Tax=marine sediment metagenome TaxID=412755 RepID=A0A0F9TX90_9ZZZZ|nr:hypothetical protein [Phycisphaerae bacterium]HDZ43907.1 hypothetical protein [Phycisphaerae bacterium]